MLGDRHRYRRLDLSNAHGHAVRSPFIAVDFIINRIFSGVYALGDFSLILPILRQAVNHGAVLDSAGIDKLMCSAVIDQAPDFSGDCGNYGLRRLLRLRLAVRICYLDLNILPVIEREGQRLIGVEGRKGAEQPVRACLLDCNIVRVGEADVCHIGGRDLRHAELVEKLAESDLTLARDAVGVVAKVEVHGIGTHEIDREALGNEAHGIALDAEVRDGLGKAVVMDVPDLKRHPLFDRRVRDGDREGAARFGLILLPV